MKKWEMLKKAYDNYPKGTNCKCYNNSYEFGIIETSGKFTINGEDINDTNGNGIYENGNWAEIITEETRIPLLVSEDGVDLYYTSYENGKFRLRFCKLRDNYKPTCYKLFSTKQAALKWIEEQNKPKEINLFENELLTVKINKDGFISTYNETINTVVHKFTGEELEKIYNAYKSLK